MCVAIYKPAGAKTPSLKTLKKCWDANPDGAGLAMRIADKKYTSQIKKGFMSWARFKKVYESEGLSEFEPELFLHFRIATHGGVCAGNTHPFPISDDVSLLQCPNVVSNYTLMHNGVLPMEPENVKISDTMELCRRLTVGRLYEQPEPVFNLLAGLIGTNKIAIMTPTGVNLFGDWKKIDGVYYSNDYWRYSPVERWSLKRTNSLFHRSNIEDDEFPPVYEVKLMADIAAVENGKCPDCAGPLTSNGSNHYCAFCDAVWRLA